MSISIKAIAKERKSASAAIMAISMKMASKMA
jgi:hypothetical protein